MKTSQFIKNSSYSVINNVLQLVISLASGMIIARMLGPEGKGTFYLIMQIVSIGSVLFSIGIGPSLLYFLKKKIITKNQAITFNLLYTIIVIIVLFLLFIFFNSFILNILNYSISVGMLSFGLVLIILNIILNFWGYIIMNNDNGIKTLSIISTIGNILNIIALFFLVYLRSDGVHGALIALLISLLLRLFWLGWYIFSGTYRFKMFSNKNVKPILKYALSIFIGNLFLTSIYRIDVFFVNGILSVYEVGIYSAAVNISELLLIIPSAIGVALFPHLTSLEVNEQTQTMCKVGRFSVVLGVVCAIFLAIVAYPFIIIIFGSKFSSAYIPTLFLLPGLVAMTLNYSYSNYLNSIGKPFVATKIFALGLVINIILNSLFLKKTGINGAAIFSSITYTTITVGFIITILNNDKCLKLKDIAIPNSADFKYIYEKIKFMILKRI